MALAWRVYYGDGTTFSSEDGGPADAPGRNVQVIVQADERVGRCLLSQHDYYVWRGEWIGVDLFGLFDYLVDTGWARVLCGRMIPHKAFRDAYQAAKADPDFPPRSGKLPKERGTR